jgi:ElaB/YqjD/DUF883 family membrane-anchored ribosome-binding protein
MDEVRNTGDTMAKETEKARERARGIADEAIQKSKESWGEIRQRGQDALNEARMRGSEALEDAQDLVRRYPGQAIGIGVLVGVLFGAFLAGRRSSDD